MATLTRKQRERAEREQAILDVARQMLTEGGYLGLNMARIARELDYSNGTIYQHFPNKEDIILALTIETLEKRSDMFERASAFRGNSRERLMAIGYAAELFVRVFPDYFNVEQTVRSASIWEKTTESRRQLMQGCEARCMGIVSGIIRDGVAAGDLQLPGDLRPEEMVFGLWSMTFGGYSIIAANNNLVELGIRQPFGAIRRNTLLIVDGYGWRPLSHEYDANAIYQRIEQEVFPGETADARLTGELRV